MVSDVVGRTGLGRAGSGTSEVGGSRNLRDSVTDPVVGRISSVRHSPSIKIS